MHNEKEDGSRSLGRSSDTVYYDGSVPTQRSGNRKRERGRDEERERTLVYTRGGTVDFGETRIGHCSLRVAISLDISVPE